MQHVVDAAIAGALHRVDVGWLFDHADQPLVARGAGAIGAGIDVGNVVADRTQPQAGLEPAHGLGQCGSVVVAGAQDVEGEALGSFGSHPGELLQFVNEPGHGLGIACHSDSS